MILLDTDHLCVLKYHESERAVRLEAKLTLAKLEGTLFGTTVITLEEQFRGWLASIAKERQARRQIPNYRDLAGLLEFFQGFSIASFDDDAVDRFELMHAIRIGVKDRKIASIALACNALLPTANIRDFEKVPGLRFANWMDAGKA